LPKTELMRLSACDYIFRCRTGLFRTCRSFSSANEIGYSPRGYVAVNGLIYDRRSQDGGKASTNFAGLVSCIATVLLNINRVQNIPNYSPNTVQAMRVSRPEVSPSRRAVDRS